jgi:Major Facilitator Superfamily.
MTDYDEIVTPVQPVVEVERTTETLTDIDIEESRFRYLRQALVGPTALLMPLYAGAFFTFGPMQLLLEQDGAFSSRCGSTVNNNQEDQETVCNEQSSSLLTVHFVATVLLNILTPVAGYISDHFGPFALTLALTLCGCTGIILIILASAARLDFLLYPGFILIGFIPMFGTVLIQETAKIFDGESSRRRIISLLNALFDGGGFVYTSLWAISKATGASFDVVMTGYLALAVVLFASILFLWKAILARQKLLVKMRSTVETSLETTTHVVSQVEEGTSTDKKEVNKPSSSYIPISHLTLREQLLSKQFLLFSIFFTIHNNRNQFTLTTARNHLAFLGDDDTGNRYLTIFMLLTAVSVVGLPIMELLVKLGGYHAALQGTNVLGIIYGLIVLTSKSLDVQVAGFCVFAIYRFFIYAACFSFLPTFVGKSVIGKMIGVLIAIAGVVSFVNIPLGRWPIESLDGNFFWPNFIYTVMIVPCIFIARFLGKNIPAESS